MSPDCIECTVLRPIARGRLAISARGSFAARENSASALICMPGAITPPKYLGLEFAHEARVTWSRLPAHLAPSAPLSVLDSSYQWIDLEGASANERLTIWARAEYGARWVLSATRLAGNGHSLGTVNAPVRRKPDTELTLELDGHTRYVLVSLTNLGNGLPDADVEPRPELARSGRLIVARAGP